MMKALSVAILLVTPAAAQEIQFSTKRMESCLGLTEDDRKKLMCVGRAAQACMEATPGGSSTAGVTRCLEAELQWWDKQLNTTYAELMGAAEEIDRDKPDNAPRRAEALPAMQRAWIVFRDAKCEFARRDIPGKHGEQVAALDCLLNETARQALYLDMSLGLG